MISSDEIYKYTVYIFEVFKGSKIDSCYEYHLENDKSIAFLF